MKAISVKQPWASMIARGEKTIETRTWTTKYRGPLLICSSKKPFIQPSGCAIAICELIDCRPMTEADEQAAHCHTYPGAWAWALAHIKPIEPFRVKGQLGIFEVEWPQW